MLAMTRDLSDELVLIVRASVQGCQDEASVRDCDLRLTLTGGIDAAPLVDVAPRWQPLTALKDEDATWEDAEWQ